MKESKDLYIFLKSHENAAILTCYGTMAKGIVHHPEDLQQNADVLQELMCYALKKPGAKEGLWLWKISNNWKSVVGWEVDI